MFGEKAFATRKLLWHHIRDVVEIVGGACTCVAGKGQAYIHIAALLFYLEDSAMVWSDTLPPHNSETNVITSPGLIPINTLNVLWCLQQHKICLTRCILAVDCSFPVQPTRSSAVASASSPSAHDFALLPSFLPSYYRLRVLELFFSYLRRWLE